MKRAAIPTTALILMSVVSCAVNPLNTGSGPSATPEPVVLTGIFIAPDGSDTNGGTNASVPLRTFHAAISNAVANGLTNIYAAAGEYRPGSGLGAPYRGIVVTNSGLHFSGGWNAGFTARSGTSILDGTNGLDHVIYAKNVTNISLEGFTVVNGYADGNDANNTNGAGLYLSNVTGCLLTNIFVRNNSALGDGGGIWFSGISNAFSVDVLSNSANYPGPDCGFGGGICVGSGSIRNTFSGNYSWNTAFGGGGLYFSSNSCRNVITAAVEHNTANGITGGGGVLFFYSDSNSFSGLIHRNTTVNVVGPMNYAGGLFIDHGSWNTVRGTICSNDGYSGGGGCIYYGSNNTVSAFVYDNVHAGYGGGLFLYHTVNATVSGVILRNQGDLYCTGGGLSIYFSSANLTNIIISGNSCGSSGGGIYQSASVVTTNGAFIYGNSPDDWTY